MLRAVQWGILGLTSLATFAEQGQAGPIYSTSAELYLYNGYYSDAQTNATSSVSGQSSVDYGSAKAVVETLLRKVPELGASADVTNSQNPATQLGFSGAGASVTATDHLTLYRRDLTSDPTIARIVVGLKLEGSLSGSFNSGGNTGSQVTATVTVQVPIGNITYSSTFQEGFEDRADGKPIWSYDNEASGSVHETLTDSNSLGVDAGPFSGFGKATLTLTLEAGAAVGPGESASAQFEDTLSVSSITFYDPNGNIISGIGVRGDSGADYPVTGSATATPEPASLTLLGLGALGLAGYARWRRKLVAA